VPILSVLAAACGDTASVIDEAAQAEKRARPGEAASAPAPSRPAAASTAVGDVTDIPGSSAPAPEERTRRLLEFDQEAVFWSAYHWAGVTPPLRQWVEPDWPQEAYRRGDLVDEFFDRDAYVDKLVAELDAAYREAGDIGYVRARIHGELGPYDSQFEELYIGPIAPGSALRAYSEKTERSTRVEFSNALDAYAWLLPPKEAQAVLASLGSDFTGRQPSRDIFVDVELRLTGARVDAGSGNGHIDAEILRYELYENRRGHEGRLLHQATITE
jgi:hypothetical protein